MKKNSFVVRRYDLINHIIKNRNYKKYLEIGVRNPNKGNFNKIIIENKTGVDPNPIVEQNNIIKSTSDNFFKNTEEKYDIIFIDGLHLEEQVDKDIINSLNHINENGIILVHDCNPITEFMQRENYEVNGKFPSWNGTVWRSIAKLRMNRSDLKIKVVNTDSGVGLIEKSENEQLFPNCKNLNYDFLDSNREKLLNLIDTDLFFKTY
jgi:hypothetical protein